MSSLTGPEFISSPEVPAVEQEPAEVIDLQDYRDEQLVADLTQPDAGVETAPVHLFYKDWQRIEAARRDEDSFTALVEEYMGFIRFVASSYFMAGGTHDDLMQEALFGFYKGVRDYDGTHSSFRSFAEICMRRQVITAIKTATRFKHQALNTYVSFAPTPNGSDSDELNLGDTLPDPGRRPEEIVIGDETFNGLIDVLKNDLSYIEYSVLKLYLEGLSYAEMAEELAEDTKAIDNAFQRVKRKVLAYLESNG